MEGFWFEPPTPLEITVWSHSLSFASSPPPLLQRISIGVPWGRYGYIFLFKPLPLPRLVVITSSGASNFATILNNQNKVQVQVIFCTHTWCFQ